jgi:DNA invertase Pin-like site-specific DNA recombinase
MFMEKAIVYLRVSSKEQGQEGFSLGAQQKLALEYAKKHNLEVVGPFFGGVESAWGKKDREEFNKLLDYAKKYKDVKHIIFDVLDRMTRNDTDKVRIIRLMKEHDKTIHFSRSNRIYSKNLNPDDEFVLDMEVAVAKKMSNDISRKTKMGMIEKAEQGIFPSCAPIGYKNNKTDCSIEVDPVIAPLIKSLFEKAALGYSLEQLADMMFVEGLRGKDGNRIRPNFAHKILHSTFYYGVFQWADNSYNGTHTPLITKELWDKVQRKLAESAQHCHSKHNHAFKGLLRCEDCGCLFIGTVATNRYNSKYSYYRCSHGKGRHHGRGYLTENQIEKELGTFVGNISLPDDVVKIIIKGLRCRGMKAARITSSRKENLEAEKKERH